MAILTMALLVAVLAVAHEVDHDVAAEALAKVHSQPAHAHHCLDVIAVDVKDRSLDHLC